MSRQWRSPADAARDPALLERAAQEFPGIAEALANPTSRRNALKLMAASMAMAGISGCADPGDPFEYLTVNPVAAPGIVPALPNYYATAQLRQGYAEGVVVNQVMGRPIKIEGNPNHPSSLGATGIHAQAMLLDFYDPDRAAGIVRDGLPSTRQALEAALAVERPRLRATRGAGLRILTSSTGSPTVFARIAALLRQYPEARWLQWDGIPRDAVRRGALLAYGAPLEAVWHPDRADVILALDSDLLSTAPGSLRYAREYASRRNPTRAEMNRVFAVESTPGLIGAAADHRFIAAPAELHAIVQRLAAAVLEGQAPDGPPWLAKVVAALKAAPGRALVHIGPDQPAELHALVHAVNAALGGRGKTYTMVAPVQGGPVDQEAEMRALIAEMADGRVESLLVFGTNPAFTVPRGWGLLPAMQRVRFRLAMAVAPNETAAAATLFVPETHDFEAWSDARGHDGTATILQPQTLPLFGATSPLEMMDLFAGPFPRSAAEIVRETWSGFLDEAGWLQALAAGVVPRTEAAVSDAPLRPEAARAVAPVPAPQPLQVLFRPDPNLWDGQYANNPWLQELPRPLTKLVWDNPLLIPPRLAQDMHLENGDIVRLSRGGERVELPVWTVPGQAPDCVTALLGYGRRVVGRVGQGTGFDLFPLRGASGPVTLLPTGRRMPIASTDHHNMLDDAPDEIVRHGTLDEFRHHPAFLHADSPQHTLYDKPKLSAQAWGMSVDLNLCIGCNACIVACQAENNIPVVGKEQVLNAREMHWLRIDRYYSGPAEAPETFLQPMLCHHCEEAPCEVVCPVEATVHDHEGLNLMVYNRCVGTRFCSNNCPYKVRRFNFLAYTDTERRMPVSRNPDVTVRARGVMEKCTFCVQRIAAARIAADRENRPVRDGEVVTACQAACPTQVFSFGNINDPDSHVATRKRSPLDYVLLPDATTHPRLTFEARIRNPDAAIVEGRT